MIPTRIGQKYAGGYYTGFSRINGAIYSLIVSPAEYITDDTVFSTDNTQEWSTTLYNGAANTNRLEHPAFVAAAHCKQLNIDGYTDWYLPSVDELEIHYKNLRPTDSNIELKWNSTLLPKTSIPTEIMLFDPDQTPVVIFKRGFVQSNTDDIWSSTSTGPIDSCFVVDFSNGWCEKYPTWLRMAKVRAFRRELVAGVE